MTLIPVDKIAKLQNPFKDHVWGFRWGGINKHDITEFLCFNDQNLCGNPVFCSAGRMDHIARIAYFVKYGWSDLIDIDVGIPGMAVPRFPVLDGNHRLAAAIYKEDKFIEAEVSGDIDYAFKLFGVEI